MFKSLIDIDVRKVAAVCGIVAAFAIPVSQDAIPHVPLSTFFEAATAIKVEGVAGLIAWACGIITGAHNIAALISPKEATP